MTTVTTAKNVTAQVLDPRGRLPAWSGLKYRKTAKIAIEQENGRSPLAVAKGEGPRGPAEGHGHSSRWCPPRVRHGGRGSPPGRHPGSTLRSRRGRRKAISRPRGGSRAT